MSSSTQIHAGVMRQIHEEHISMKPRMYFLLGSALTGAGIAGAVVTSIFFTHITLYRLHYDAVLDYLEFGSSGVRPMMTVFPWVPFVVAVSGLLGGSYLIHAHEIPARYRYKRVLLICIAILLTAGFLMHKSPLSKFARQFQPLNSLYDYEQTYRPYVAGTVLEARDDYMIIQTLLGELIRIDMTGASHSPDISSGASVRAIGSWDGDTFKAHILRVK